MYNVKFIKIKNNHDRLRDDVIKGSAVHLPIVGQKFIFVGSNRDGVRMNGVRMINTNLVTKINFHDLEGRIVEFKTESESIYRVEYKEV